MENINKMLFFCMIIVTLFSQTSAVDFIFNGFDHSSLLMYGNATIEEQSSHKILSLTQNKQFSIGRALYHKKIPTNSSSLSFHTSFVFSMAPYKNTLPGHGFVFIFTPKLGIEGTSSAQNLGLFNRTNDGNSSNHVFGVEFDVFMNEEFDDVDENHVGIDINSLTSNVSHTAGYWPDDTRDESDFVKLKLNDGEDYQVWIDYFELVVNVSMAKIGKKRPLRPLLSARIDLSQVFMDEMYVGFTSSTGKLVESHKILAWSFSNSNSSIGDSIITTGLPSFVLPKDNEFLKSKGLIIGVTLSVLFGCALCALIFVWLLRKRKPDNEEVVEEWEMEYWPHRLGFKEIEMATDRFAEKNVIGFGGNGMVYKGVLQGSEVAVKRISRQNGEGTREFLAEITSLGRLKHRNLVGLRGWCKGEKGSFILVYDYMENGSLDKWIFKGENSHLWLNLKDRIRILRDVAFGLVYLHEEWECKVLHRDIKASNVLLDKDMNGKLGDFGLARLHERDQVPTTTQVVGTVGYLAPEVVRRGRASTEADVYSFGVLVLEVLCGRRPIEDNKPGLVEWVSRLMAQGELKDALDESLRDSKELENVDAERVLRLGLVCTCPDPKARPKMGQVVKILERSLEGSFGEECGESMEENLLGRMRRGDLGGVGHQDLDEIRLSMFSSTSISWSDVLSEGR